MSNDLFDRAMLQSVLDRWDRNIYAQVHGAMEDLRSALASSTAMPDDKDKRIAELEADYKALSHKMIAETAHVAELERDKAELLENGDRLKRAADGGKEQCKELQRIIDNQSLAASLRVGTAQAQIAELEAELLALLDLADDRLAQITADRKAYLDLRDALRASLTTLKISNEQLNGPIRDTIWHSPYETLFDFMEAALEQGEKE